MSEPNQTPQTTSTHGESVPPSSVSGRTAAIVIVLLLIVGAVIAIAGIFHRQSARQLAVPGREWVQALATVAEPIAVIPPLDDVEQPARRP